MTGVVKHIKGKMPNYEVLFYLEKAVRKVSRFDSFKTASEYMLTNMAAYMESDYFLANTDSSYCVTVFDVRSTRFIQLLGPNDEQEKGFIETAFKNTGKKW
jgi:hypothetical protein